MLGSPYEILSLHCSLLNLQRSLGAPEPYSATESYLLCVSGVSCHGEKIPFEVWPPSFTLTIMLLALSCPPCKSPCLLFCPAPSPPLLHTPWLFSFVSLSVTFFTLFSVRRSGPKRIPARHAGKCSRSPEPLFCFFGLQTDCCSKALQSAIKTGKKVQVKFRYTSR